jgi:hypothetical protein
LIKEQHFFDASNEAWFLNRDANDVMDMFYDVHNDTQGEFVKDHVFYDTRPDPFDYGTWMAPTLTFLGCIQQMTNGRWR